MLKPLAKHISETNKSPNFDNILPDLFKIYIMLLSEIKFFNPKLSYILKESLKQKQKLKFKFDLTKKNLLIDSKTIDFFSFKKIYSYLPINLWFYKRTNFFEITLLETNIFLPSLKYKLFNIKSTNFFNQIF